jgi:ABC-type uncharacterized transport system substrate-binding protein
MRLTTVGLIATFILAILVAPPVTGGQQPAKAPRIGVLMPALNPERTRNLAAFRDALRDLGWVEGQNLAMEYRFAEQGLGQFPALAADLVRLKVDVLVVGGGAPAVRAAKEATSTITVVMVSAGALEAGLIDSLAKPGGNITGTVSVQAELMARRLEILKEAMPGIARLAVLVTPRHRSDAALRDTQHAAQALGVALHVQEVRSPDEFLSAFAAIQQAGAEALLVSADVLSPHVRRRWGPHVLRDEPAGVLPTHGLLRRPHSERHQARRFAGGNALAVRAGHQPQGGQSPGAHHSPNCPVPGRRGAPMTALELLVTLALSILVAPLAANAQPAGQMPRLGVLTLGPRTPGGGLDAFLLRPCSSSRTR